MRIIKVGSRESRLAVVQAGIVIDAIRRVRPEIETRLVTMKTSGDAIVDRPLEGAGGKGLFTRELDEALRGGLVDICVHSYKDMPVPGVPELPVVAVCGREDPRDVLVPPEGAGEPSARLPIGTSSPRRRRQLAQIFPGCRCEPIRGNIETRLRKLDAGEYGALVLAAAGLKRLGLWRRVGRVFAVDEIIPAACQGMLAVQCRADDVPDWLAGIHDPDAFDAAVAERSFVEALGANCVSPVAAFAEIVGENELRLSAMHAFLEGPPRKGSKTGPRRRAAAIGRELAMELKAEGAEHG